MNQNITVSSTFLIPCLTRIRFVFVNTDLRHKKIEKRKVTENIIFFFIDFILFFVENLSWLRNIWYTIPILTGCNLSQQWPLFISLPSFLLRNCNEISYMFKVSLIHLKVYFRLLEDVWSLKFFNELKSERIEHRLFFLNGWKTDPRNGFNNNSSDLSGHEIE